jgi:hypothetical protein
VAGPRSADQAITAPGAGQAPPPPATDPCALTPAEPDTYSGIECLFYRCPL